MVQTNEKDKKVIRSIDQPCTYQAFFHNRSGMVVGLPLVQILVVHRETGFAALSEISNSQHQARVDAHEKLDARINEMGML